MAITEQKPTEIRKYGAIFPAGTQLFQIELWCWANYGRLKNPELQRWEHLRNACMILVPNFAKTYNGWAEKCIIAYAENPYIAAVGCSNSGKTHMFHTLAFVDYMSDPLNTQVICTTTSVQGLKTRMWPILSGLFKHLKPSQWVMRTAPHMMIMSNKDDPKHTIRAVPIAAKADKTEITDNIIGAHTKRIIWIVDESTSAPAAIFDAWSNLAGGTEHRRLIMLGNPDDQLDTLGRFCRPDDGWDSVTADTEEWFFQYQGERGKALHFDGEKSPNLDYPANTDGSSKWSFLFGHFDLQRHKANQEQSPLSYWRFCRGWYADASLVPKVITMQEIEKNNCRGEIIFQGNTRNFASLDPAFGGDRAILKIWKMGIDSESRLNAMQQLATMEVPITPKSIIGQEIGEFVMKKSKEFDFDVIGIDTTTDNSAPAEYLKLNSSLEVIDISFGGRPSDEPVSVTDQTTCSERYDRRVSELWFNIKMALHQIRGLDNETIIELCSRYFTRIGKPEKLRVETKQEMKLRAHGKSPDLADSVALAVAVFKKLGGFEPIGKQQEDKKWKRLARRRNSIYNSTHSYMEN